MITLRRADERCHVRRGEQDIWFVFHRDAGKERFATGFGALENLDEHRLSPGAGVPLHIGDDVEIVTYVLDGALMYSDATGRSGVIHSGEFQRVTAGPRIRYREANLSQTEWGHVFHIWLRPSQAGLEPGQEQKRFSVAERRGKLCVVGSPDGRKGSLRIHQDILIYSAILDPGQHLAHELSSQRRAWLHVVRGDVMLGDVILTTGDGAGITAERAISLTAREEAEILLVDLGEPGHGAS